MSHRNLPITVTLPASLVIFLLSCRPPIETTSNVKNTNANERVYVAINETSSDQVAIYFSTAASDQVTGLCVMQVTDTQSCSEDHSGYAGITEVKGTATDRKFFTINGGLKIDQNMHYTIINPAKEVLLKFKFVSSSTDNSQLSLENAMALIKAETLREELTYFSSDEFNGRLSGTQENNKAADWLIEKLKELQITPLGDNGTYRQKFRVPQLGNVETANIIGLIEGQDPALKNEYIVIGAHMDHIGTRQRGYNCRPGNVSGDMICNGADDNGSGSIGLLNVVKALSQSKHLLKRSVIIMWFSGEEEGMVGSKYFVNNPTVNLRQIVYMINLDMIGYLRQNGNRLEAISASSSKTGRTVASEIASKYPSIKMVYDAPPQGGSDHSSFMGKGIPAIFFNTGVKSNPHYHRATDSADKIDYEGMELTARIAFEQLIKISERLPSSSNGFGLANGNDERPPLLPEYELEKSCHHLIELEDERLAAFDFRYGNSGHAEFIQAP